MAAFHQSENEFHEKLIHFTKRRDHTLVCRTGDHTLSHVHQHNVHLSLRVAQYESHNLCTRCCRPDRFRSANLAQASGCNGGRQQVKVFDSRPKCAILNNLNPLHADN